MSLGFDDLEILASRLGKFGGEAVLPNALTSFIVELLRNESPQQVFDPFAFSGGLTTKLFNELKPQSVSGMIRGVEQHEIATQITPPEINYKHANSLVDWPVGETFDAVVCCPPFNMRSEPIEIEINGKQTRVNDDYGNQLLVKACQSLSPEGVAVFVMPCRFFMRASRPNGAFAAIQSMGFDIDASVELPAGTFLHTNIVAHVVSFRRNTGDKIFTGRLPDDGESQKQLLENLRKRKQSGNLSLGVLVERESFRGFAAIENELKLQKLARKMGLKAFKTSEVFVDCMASRSGPNFERLEEGSDSVFLPRMGRGKATTSQDELSERLRNYFKLEVDPTKTDAEFVAKLLNSPLGELWRESVSSGSVMTAITRTQLMDSNFYLPHKDIQVAMVECDQKISNAMADLTALKDQLWSRPAEVQDVADGLRPFEQRANEEEWIESLPFPLASILRICHTETGSFETRYKRKLQFFEALAQFVALIHMSAFSSDSKLWEEVSGELTEKLDKHNLGIERATFGTWVAINQKLIKQARELLKGDETEDYSFELYQTSDRRMLAALTSKEFLTTIQQANSLRNKWDGHSGMVGEAEAKAVDEKLNRYIDDVRNIFGFLWEKYQLLMPGSNEYDAGVFLTNVQLLSGTKHPFKTAQVEVTSPMQKDTLHFKSPDREQTLKLLPFIKMLEPASKEQNACYFYSRRTGDGFRFNSYHFRSESNVEQHFIDTEKAIVRLFPS